jgi:hypothetical protein
VCASYGTFRDRSVRSEAKLGIQNEGIIFTAFCIGHGFAKTEHRSMITFLMNERKASKQIRDGMPNAFRILTTKHNSGGIRSNGEGIQTNVTQYQGAMFMLLTTK